jgi:hypothetical protein
VASLTSDVPQGLASLAQRRRASAVTTARRKLSLFRWCGYRFTSHKITLSTTLMMSEVISGK